MFLSLRMKNIAQKIKAVRKEKGYTQEEVANALGMSKANVSKIENGEISLAPDNLNKLANFFQITPEQFLTFETVQERLGLTNDQPSLEETINQLKAQIKRMQQSTERYIEAHLNQHEITTTQHGGRLDEPDYSNVSKGILNFFRINGLENLLNGENTTPDYPLLEAYKDYKKTILLASIEQFARDIEKLIKEDNTKA